MSWSAADSCWWSLDRPTGQMVGFPGEGLHRPRSAVSRVDLRPRVGWLPGETLPSAVWSPAVRSSQEA